jgi:hypothetical protein
VQKPTDFQKLLLLGADESEAQVENESPNLIESIAKRLMEGAGPQVIDPSQVSKGS